MADTNIQRIRFKRGTKAALEAQLVSGKLGVLYSGEPAFEVDTGQLKIGNGVDGYPDLPYVGAEAIEDGRFVIQDPTDGQILVYNSVTKKWTNQDFPISKEELQTYLNNTAQNANLASTYATRAANSAAEAEVSALTADRINQQTMAYVNNKFWWGTVDEYNALESISADTFYFISVE